MYLHEVLVNRLGKACPGKSAVMWIDRPDMTIDVDWDVKQQTKSKEKRWAGWFESYVVKTNIRIFNSYYFLCLSWLD